MTSDAPQILVVDDNPKNLLAIEAALGEFDGCLDMVGSGAAALRKLLEREYALILLDVHMPELDGFETAKLIRGRAKTKHLPIIFVTAYDQGDARVREGYELGAVDFLFKPVEPSILRAKVNVFVELTRRTQEVERQANQLRVHEQREALARLETERQAWKQASLQREMEQQRALAAETQQRAEQLAALVAQLEAAQRELARSNAQLAEGDRRKNEFLATLAHELRNPLAPLGYAVGLLQDSPDEGVRSICERMSRQLAHVTRLVDDLLDVSRVTSAKIELKRETIDLRAAIEQGIELARDALTRNGSVLEVALGDAPVPIDADNVRIAQVVGNLLNNAARYTKAGGHVEVELSTDDQVCVLTVRDDGPGIDPDTLDTIFEAFVQGPTDAGGLGLGLHLAERLVRMHEGTIRARNRDTGGARFDIELPLSDAAARNPSPTPSDAPSRSLRVALIEDDEDIREMSKLLLMHWGYETLEASDGHSGIALVAAHADELDAVVVDIGLPDIAGYEVASSLTARLAERCPPLIAVTGWGQARDRERALAAGFTAHLVKPVRPEDLQEALVRVSSARPQPHSAKTGGDDNGDA